MFQKKTIDLKGKKRKKTNTYILLIHKRKKIISFLISKSPNMTTCLSPSSTVVLTPPSGGKFQRCNTLTFPPSSPYYHSLENLLGDANQKVCELETKKQTGAIYKIHINFKETDWLSLWNLTSEFKLLEELYCDFRSRPEEIGILIRVTSG